MQGVPACILWHSEAEDGSKVLHSVFGRYETRVLEMSAEQEATLAQAQMTILTSMVSRAPSMLLCLTRPLQAMACCLYCLIPCLGKEHVRSLREHFVDAREELSDLKETFREIGPDIQPPGDGLQVNEPKAIAAPHTNVSAV